MSGLVSGLVWRHYPARPGKMVIIQVLAEFADQTGRNIYPSIRLITEMTGASDRTIQRHIKSFLEEGVLLIVKKGGGRKMTNHYRIDLEFLESLPIKTSDKPRQNVTLSENKNPDTVVSPFNRETPTIETETPTIGALNPDTAVSPDPLDPPIEADGDSITVDNSESSSSNQQQKFKMFLSWQPDETFNDRCRVSGLILSKLENHSDHIGEFASYWSTRNETKTQSEWEHKLVANLKRVKSYEPPRPQTDNSPQRSDEEEIERWAISIGVTPKPGESCSDLYKRCSEVVMQS